MTWGREGESEEDHLKRGRARLCFLIAIARGAVVFILGAADAFGLKKHGGQMGG